MHSAPSVSYPVGRSVVYWRLLCVTAIAAMGALMLGACYASEAKRVLLVGGAAWVTWVVLVTLAWRTRQPQGRLAWVAAPERQAADPQLRETGHWSWVSGAYLEGVSLTRVERVHDQQTWMLLRLHNPDGARSWVWVEQHVEPHRWDDFRRALWSHA
jgi:small-conductance mechanosensitive channel